MHNNKNDGSQNKNKTHRVYILKDFPGVKITSKGREALVINHTIVS